ncbi:hypothetical protein EET67_04200 [Pseudaminobacter arsenicus]|uniref:Lipopolysaccharide biosynthesis protein n=1 Tax=Borborobacter arsenicus TaxID=1851146 RepID=A0A432V9S4_9HYPH|nr:oligosaccharide flippase family protein [Pseudaminobacter arsenicus]RUM98855.1 hypothetical protein EET67_04200 [Pseudaminobacter arsenicus]
MRNPFQLGAFQLHMLVQALGTSLSQIILILISPVLTRLYGPEEFGVYGLVLSISTLLAIVITLRVDHGIIVSSTDEQAKNIAIMTLLMALLGGIICSVIGALIAGFLYGFDGTQLLIWSFFGPLVAILTAANRTLTLFNNRLQFFSLVSYARFAQSGCFAAAAIVFGLLSVESYGLIVALALGNLIYVLMLMRHLLPLHGVHKSTAAEIFSANRNFIKFSLPADLVNTLASRMPFILFPIFFGLQETGFLSLAYQVIATPSRFVGKAIGEVFYSHAAREYEKTGTCWQSVKKVAWILILVGLPGFTILLVFAEPLFSLVFGEQWVTSANYTQILTPMLFINFVVSPVSVVFYIAGRQKEDFQWQVSLLVTTSLACCVGIWFGGALSSLVALSASGALMYCIYFGFIQRFAKGNRSKA